MAYATNVAQVQFPAPTPGAWPQPTEWRFMATASGSGDVLARGSITKVDATDPDAPPIGSDVDFPIGQLRITVAASTGVPAAGAEAAVRGIVDRTGYVRLFDTNGDEISGNAYAGVEMELSDWNIVQ